MENDKTEQAAGRDEPSGSTNAMPGNPPTIHPTARIDPSAKVHNDARVEAQAELAANTSVACGGFVGERTKLGAGASVANLAHCGSDVVLGEKAEVGCSGKVSPHAAIGDGTVTSLRCWIVSSEENPTRIGARCRLMHDVLVGEGATIGDDVEIDPYVEIGSRATIGHRVKLKRRTHSLFRQGLMLYHHLPNWPEDRIRPLMETFGSMLMEQRVYREVFGVI